MYIISLSCIIYTYCKLILKSPSGRINKKVLYCIVISAPNQNRHATHATQAKANINGASYLECWLAGFPASADESCKVKSAE